MEGFAGVCVAAFGASAGVGGTLEGVKAVGAYPEILGADAFRDLAPAQVHPDERCIKDADPDHKDIETEGERVGRPEAVEHEDKRQDNPDDREEVASIDVHKASAGGLSVLGCGVPPAVQEKPESPNHEENNTEAQVPSDI